VIPTCSHIWCNKPTSNLKGGGGKAKKGEARNEYINGWKKFPHCKAVIAEPRLPHDIID